MALEKRLLECLMSLIDVNSDAKLEDSRIETEIFLQPGQYVVSQLIKRPEDQRQDLAFYVSLKLYYLKSIVALSWTHLVLDTPEARN